MPAFDCTQIEHGVHSLTAPPVLILATVFLSNLDVSDKSRGRTDAFVRSSELRHDIDERTKASVLRFRSIATIVGNVNLMHWILWRAVS